MSVKSVPGNLVLIAPSLIGLPLALAPGFGPHYDVDDAAAEARALAWPVELNTANAASTHAPMTAARPTPQRARGVY
jgi:hypothetical protein